MRLASLAAILLLAACAADPPQGRDVRLSASEHAEQVGRDVGAIVQGMRNAHGID